MKALTIWEPWASLLAYGIKLHETRSWAPPAALIGKRLAIHAGKTDQGLDQFATATSDPVLGRHRQGALERLASCLSRRGENLTGMPGRGGRVLGTAKLLRVIETGSELGRRMPSSERALGDWTPGRFAWLFVEPRPCRLPPAVTGRQGLWDLTGVCRECSCTTDCACDGGCCWVELDLCSSCAGE